MPVISPNSAVKLCLALCLMSLMAVTQELGKAGIDELDAVIDFDQSDDLFMFLTSRDSTCVHLYSRKDPQYLAKKKAFRKAAKRDIDKSTSNGFEMREVTQWLAIDKEMLQDKLKGRQYQGISFADEDVIDDMKLMQVFGVHQPITFYGYMNMKHSIEFPIADSGDHIVEDAVEAILIEKGKRIQRLLPTVSCDYLDSFIKLSDQPTVAFFGSPTQIQGFNAKLGYLRNIHQASLMAFSNEQHYFVSVLDINCIRTKGYSTKEDDWTLVYYPAGQSKSPEDLDAGTGIKVKRVNYPRTSAFGETVHWLDSAYAEDLAEWSKHASVCLSSHEMNILILFLDTKSAIKTQKYAEAILVFKQAVQKVTSKHNLKIIPVVYPIGKQGPFGDENQRLETVMGLNLEEMTFPAIGILHGTSKNFWAFPHVIIDSDAFIPDLVGYWAVHTVLQADLDYKQEKIVELSKELSDGEELGLLSHDQRKDTEFQLNLQKKDVSDILNIVDRAEHAYKFAALESRWAQYMREQGIVEKEARMQFLRQAYVDEGDLTQRKQEAQLAVQEVIKEMEADLIAQGVTNEQERLQIILAQLKQQEARLIGNHTETLIMSESTKEDEADQQTEL